MARRLFLVLFILVAVSGCKRDGPPIEGGRIDYFPMARGDRWVYASGFPPVFSDTITYMAKGKVQLLDGKEAWRMVRSWKRPDTSRVDTSLISKREDGIGFHAFPDDTVRDILLRFPLEVGTEWVMAGSLPVARIAEVVSVETVSVSGMSFPDCFKVESHDVNKDSVLTNRYDWYAPNVGRVKTVIEARGKVHETRLVKYRVR